MEDKDLIEAIELLKNVVNESNIKNQKFIDLTLVKAEERFKYQKALLVTRTMVDHGKITEEELKIRLGL
jgi:transcription initiation factor IIE alpha subunit